ncbi:hypothetical protein M2344_000250 [Sphingobium sp. B8D3C]|nr:hypothetical protein [Sphingobium sp. B8D3C]
MPKNVTDGGLGEAEHSDAREDESHQLTALTANYM